MWDRSFRSQRVLRMIAGAAVGLAAVVGLAIAARTPVAARLGRAVRQRIEQARATGADPVIVAVPQSLGVAAGDLIHLERRDGESEVVGRVVRTVARSATTDELQLELLSPAVHQATHHWLLKGAPRAVGLEAVVRLLLSPDPPLDEARRARDAICPTIEAHLLPQMTSRLWPELTELFQNPSDEDVRLLQQAIAEIRGQLAPLETELVDRMSHRAWQIVGLRGMAAGLWRMTSGGVENTAKDLRDWWSRRIGAEVPDDREVPDFLSTEIQAELRQGLQEEWTVFWNEHRDAVTARMTQVLAQHSQSLTQAARERWGPHLLERVVQPAWSEGEAEVIRAVERYAQDFTGRRLLTPRGAPRLLLAHALRSELGINTAPLLLLAPAPTDSATSFQYEPLVP